MAKEPRANRIPIMFSEEELTEIDEWRHTNRIATRADAVRRLCKIALFIDEELGEIVDVVSGGVEVLSEHNSELDAVYRLIMNRETYGLTFTRENLMDVFDLARVQADVAEEGMRAMQFTLINIFNAVAAIVDAKSIKTGVKEFEEIIAKANATIEEADRRKVEREAYSEENRYIAIISRARDALENETYRALDEDKKEEYLTGCILKMKAEEAADPQGFAERHGIDNRKFWEKPEWQQLLDERQEAKRQAEGER